MVKNILFVWALTLGCWAQAASLSLLGVQDISQISAQGTQVSTGQGYGGGLLVSFPLAYRLSLEVGALYFNRQWDDTTTGSKNTLSSQVIQAPLVFNIHLLHFLSIGLGGYYASTLGDLKQTDIYSNTTTLTYQAYGIKTTDYGAIGDINLHFNLLSGVYLRLDGRYSYGLTNLATTSGNNFYYRDLQILAGFAFPFGGGSSSPEVRSR